MGQRVRASCPFSVAFQEGPTNGMARTGLWPPLSVRDLGTLQLLSFGKREGKLGRGKIILIDSWSWERNLFT